MSESHTLHLHLLYLSGELTPEQEQLIEDHHRDCRLCRLDLQRLQSTLERYQRLETESPPAELLLALRRRARQAALADWQWRLVQWLRIDWRWLRAIAVTTAMVLLAVLVARLPRQNATAMLEPLLPITTTADAHLSELKQRLSLLESGSVRPGAQMADEDRSDALIDDELKSIRSRMNELARNFLID